MRSFNVSFSCYLKQAAEQSVDILVISDAMMLMWRHCNIIVTSLW